MKTGKGKTPSAADVEIYRAARKQQGTTLTRKQAKAEMLQRAAAIKAAQDAKDREEGAKLVKEMNDRAREQVAEALQKFVDVRSVLEGIAKDSDFGGIDRLDAADMAVSHLQKYGGRLEQALYQLGVWEGLDPIAKRRPREGWFKDSLDQRLVE